jgi:hypothetical protein
MKINYYHTQESYPYPELNTGIPLEYLTTFTQGILDETIKDSEYILYFKEENKEFEYKKHFTSEQELIDIISNAHKFLDIFKQTQENEINK